MEINPITEVWQAASIVRLAQESIMEHGDPQTAYRDLDHAKRHLMRLLDYWLAQDCHQFVEGTKHDGCTLIERPLPPRPKPYLLPKGMPAEWEE